MPLSSLENYRKKYINRLKIIDNSIANLININYSILDENSDKDKINIVTTEYSSLLTYNENIELLSIKKEEIKQSLEKINKVTKYIKTALNLEFKKIVNKSEILTYFDINADKRRAKFIADENIILSETAITNEVEKWVNDKIFKGDKSAPQNFLMKYNPFGLKTKTRKFTPLYEKSRTPTPTSRLWGNTPGESFELNQKKISEDEFKSIEWPKGTIKFYIQDLRSKNIMIFPALITSLTETVSPSWQQESFIGRTEGISGYTDTSNSVEISFDMIAESMKNLVYIYYKLQWLKQACYAKYDSSKTMITTPPLIRFRIGDLMVSDSNDIGLCGYISNLSSTYLTEEMWERTEKFQFPIHVQVSLGISIIHDNMPNDTTKFYRINDNILDRNITRNRYERNIEITPFRVEGEYDFSTSEENKKRNSELGK